MGVGAGEGGVFLRIFALLLPCKHLIDSWSTVQVYTQRQARGDTHVTCEWLNAKYKSAQWKQHSGSKRASNFFFFLTCALFHVLVNKMCSGVRARERESETFTFLEQQLLRSTGNLLNAPPQLKHNWASGRTDSLSIAWAHGLVISRPPFQTLPVTLRWKETAKWTCQLHLCGTFT